VQAHPLAGAIETLASMPAFVESALDAVPRATWTHKPGEDAFSLVEQACHLRDVERDAYVVRVRRVLAEERPVLAGFDGTTVARERAYLTQDARRAAQEFAAARGELTALLAATTPGDLRREATFVDERVTLEQLVGMMVEHDREHRGEIVALRDALGADEPWK
jgi:uncharacterized damage-inducible protein DinB